MSTPNPLMPQGSLPQAKGKSNIKIAMFAILAIHVVLIGGILITQGCKSESKAPEPIAEAQPQPSLDLPPIDQAQELTNSTAYGYANPYAASTQQVSSLPASAPGTQQVSALPPTAPLPGQVTPQTTSQVVPQPYDTSSSVAAETQTHAVAKGESYTTIAKKYGVTIKAIETANPNVEPTRLQIGQKITIPTPAGGNVTASAPASAETAISADTTALGPRMIGWNGLTPRPTPSRPATC